MIFFRVFFLSCIVYIMFVVCSVDVMSLFGGATPSPIILTTHSTCTLSFIESQVAALSADHSQTALLVLICLALKWV